MHGRAARQGVAGGNHVFRGDVLRCGKGQNIGIGAENIVEHRHHEGRVVRQAANIGGVQPGRAQKAAHNLVIGGHPSKGQKGQILCLFAVHMIAGKCFVNTFGPRWAISKYFSAFNFVSGVTMSGRILVVDDVATNRVILKAKLATAYFDVIQAANGQEALDLARSAHPDIILLDIIMPDMDGYQVCKTLKSNPETAHIPVVMVTAMGAPDERIRGLNAGADDFLTKPINDVALFARVRNLVRVKIMFDELRLRDSTTRELGLSEFVDAWSHESDLAGSVLLTASSADEAACWGHCLKEKLDLQVFETGSEREAFALATLESPDAYIVHQHLQKGGDGLRLVSALRARHETRQSAIIFVVGDGLMETAERALDLGASDYIMPPYDKNELTARLRSQLRRKHYSDRLRSNVRDGLRMAVTDPLTGLFNRRYCTQHMGRIVDRAQASGGPFTVMMLDLDRFKQVNDSHGHEAGDAVLVEFARRLQENVRGVDLVARLGGEEFLVAMPDADNAAAQAVAERIRAAVETRPFKLDNGAQLAITVSIGVAVAGTGETDAQAVIGRADLALYKSKAAGRNVVSFYASAA